MNEVSLYDKLSAERKRLQQQGELPDWLTTPAWQILKSKYLSPGETLRQRFETIAKTAAGCGMFSPSEEWKWAEKFFNLLWRGWLAPSTPVLSNMGTDKGQAVSCSGSYIGDSIYDFYENRKEGALLSKNGFGTSGYLGDIRPRGTPISVGGYADGVVPVFKGHLRMARDVSQGGTRRGSWAGYLPIDHGDFWELINFVANNPDDANVGWNISSKFIESLNKGDEDSHNRFRRALKTKMVTGKGYFFFPDKVNELSPPMYKDLGLEVKASNLCTEITLFSDLDHTFTCVLSSLNLAKYDEWKDTDAVFNSTVFLDCVAQDFINKGRHIRGLERAVRFTEKSRALGLGTLGWHTYLQQNWIGFESFEAHTLNGQIYKNIREQADAASRWMAESFGEPEWCRGYGVRNTHVMSIAPNLSSALICGSVSQGIEPVYMNAYTQGTSGGEVDRINPVILDVMKERGVYSEKVVLDIAKNQGSVQDVDWLDSEEKKVFKTAFEIDQFAIIRLAASRQRYIDQAQSINLFFSSSEKEEVIAAVHQEAFTNPWIKSLYYIRSEAGVKGSTGECEACAG